MLTTKPGVRFGVITPALLYMLTTLERLSRTLFGLPDEGLVITAGSDGTHMAGSKHYTGEAVDLRSKTLNSTVKSGFIAILRAELGPQFTVLLEGEGTPNEHLHVQVRRGRAFDPDELVQDKHAAALIRGLRERGRKAHARKVMHLHVAARAARRRGDGAIERDDHQPERSARAVESQRRAAGS